MVKSKNPAFLSLTRGLILGSHETWHACANDANRRKGAPHFANSIYNWIYSSIFLQEMGLILVKQKIFIFQNTKKLIVGFCIQTQYFSESTKGVDLWRAKDAINSTKWWVLGGGFQNSAALNAIETPKYCKILLIHMAFKQKNQSDTFRLFNLWYHCQRTWILKISLEGFAHFQNLCFGSPHYKMALP